MLFQVATTPMEEATTQATTLAMVALPPATTATTLPMEAMTTEATTVAMGALPRATMATTVPM